AVDTLVAGTTPGSNRPPPPMFAPIRLRGLTIPNRVVVSPMCQYSAKDGTVNDWHLVHLGSRAIGGAGLIIAEMTDVLPEGRISLHCAGMYKPEHVGAWKRITDFVHANSESKIAVQLAHAGRKGSLTRSWEGHKSLGEAKWELIAPSPLAFAEGRQVPREMTRADMDKVRDAFVRASEMAEAAGIDILAVSTGGVSSAQRPVDGRTFQATFSDQIRNELGIPTMAVGGIVSHGDINTIVAAGRADMCALARGYLEDAYFTRHAARAQGYAALKWPSQYRRAGEVQLRGE